MFAISALHPSNENNMFSHCFLAPPKGDIAFREYLWKIDEDLTIKRDFTSLPKVSIDGIILKHVEETTDILTNNFSIRLELNDKLLLRHPYGVEVLRDGQELTIYIQKLQRELLGTYHLTLINDAGLKSSYTFSVNLLQHENKGMLLRCNSRYIICSI